MSDMLQLVVEIAITQAMILPVSRTLRAPNLDDKLKHVGHLTTNVGVRDVFHSAALFF
jgi:hypothetical protein